MAWVKASMPQAAVRDGGQLLVNSGSHSATEGNKNSEAINDLRPVRFR